MREFLMVFCTCASEQEAFDIAHRVVEQRLAACVNILPPVRSVYRWEGKIETASEYLLLAKTTRERFAALRDGILELHTYENPEIVAVTLADGTNKYFAWIEESV